MQQGSILIVDDEMGPRESLRMILKPFYKVYVADNGLQALEMVRQKEIDLVTLDLKMPEMQGIETLKEIKAIRSSIEVIIVTGFGSLKTAIDGIRLGAANYLVKPFNISEMVSAVNQALEKKQAGDRFRTLVNDLCDQVGERPETLELRKVLCEQGALPLAIRPGNPHPFIQNR